MSQSITLVQTILAHFELLAHLHTNYNTKKLLAKLIMKVITKKACIITQDYYLVTGYLQVY